MPETPTITEADRLNDASKAAAEHERAMVGHAVALLNNHLPSFGWKVNEDHESWKSSGDLRPDLVDGIPAHVRVPLESAIAHAATYLMRVFASQASRIPPASKATNDA